LLFSTVCKSLHILTFPTRRSSDLTERYYKQEGEVFFADSANKVVDFVKKALTRIEQEKKRVLLYLNPSTLEKLMQTCNKTLIERSEEHTSELQSRFDLVCRLLLEK